MSSIDIKVTAERTGTAEDDGMDLGELEAAVNRFRFASGKDTAKIRVGRNRNGRIRSLVLEMRDEDTNRDAGVDATDGGWTHEEGHDAPADDAHTVEQPTVDQSPGQ